MASTADTTGTGRTPPQIGRVRRGWLFRDCHGCGWWLDDTVVTNGAHRVMPIGAPAAQCRVFTPIVAARNASRRIYWFAPEDDHRVSLHAVEQQLAQAADDPPAGNLS